MKNRVVRLLLAAGAAIAFVACTPGGGSIYYTLETEVEVVDNSLPNGMTVFDIAKIGSAYYLAAGKIWTVDDAAAAWDVDAVVTPPRAGDICTALVASPFVTGTLFGGFIDGSGNRGLFESTAAPSFDGAAAIAALGTSQVAMLTTTANPAGELVVVTATQPAAGESFEFGIVTSGDGTTFAPLPFDATRPDGDEMKPINDVIWSTTVPTDAWFATEGTKLYTDGGTGTMTLATMTGITAGEELTGLFDDGTNVYIASKAGAVYYSSDGATWTRIAAPTVSGAHPRLTRFAGPVYAGILLVGSEEFGYYRLDTADLGSGTDAITRFPTSTIGLHTATVTRFLFDADPDPDRVFAGTAMGGLWRGKVSGTDGSIGWNLE